MTRFMIAIVLAVFAAAPHAASADPERAYVAANVGVPFQLDDRGMYTPQLGIQGLEVGYHIRDTSLWANAELDRLFGNMPDAGFFWMRLGGDYRRCLATAPVCGLVGLGVNASPDPFGGVGFAWLDSRIGVDASYRSLHLRPIATVSHADGQTFGQLSLQLGFAF